MVIIEKYHAPWSGKFNFFLEISQAAMIDEGSFQLCYVGFGQKI